MPTLSRPDSFNVSFFDEEKARRNLNRFGEYIIGYARLSFDEDGEGYCSIINQQEILRSFYEKKFETPHSHYEFIADDNVSGYKFDRSGLFRVLDRIENGLCNIIIAKDLSRIGRHSALTQLFIEQCERVGIRIVAMDDYDSHKQSDELILGIRAWSNERLVKDTSAKILKIVKHKQENGTWFCAAPFGYRVLDYATGKVEIDEEAAEIVRRIADMYVNGYGINKIARILTEEGVPTPNMHLREQRIAEGKTFNKPIGEKWMAAQISKMLDDDFYIGTLRTGKYRRRGINGNDVRRPVEEQHVFENHHEPILTREIHERIKEIKKTKVKTHDRGYVKNETMFHGILFCGDCGYRLYAYQRKDLATQYVCSNYFKYGKTACTRHTIKEKLLVDIAFEYLEHVRDVCKDTIAELDDEVKSTRKLQHRNRVSAEQIQRELVEKRGKLTVIEEQRIKQIIAHPEREEGLNKIYDQMFHQTQQDIEALEKELQILSDVDASEKNSALNKAKTALSIIDGILEKKELLRRDVLVLFDRITVFEDGRVTITLQDEMLGRLMMPERRIVEKPQKQPERVYDVSQTVNVVSDGDPWTILNAAWQEGNALLAFAPEAITVFSCAARRTFWGNAEVGKETEPYQTVAPTSGFYTSGEFLRTNGFVNQHNVTQVIVAMREGEAKANPEHEIVMSTHSFEGKVSMINRMATFIKVTSEELAEANSKLAEANGKLEEANRQLSELAVTDTLTGIGNKTAYFAKAREMDAEIAAKRACFTVAVFDLNGLKTINDNYGHECGDKAIVDAAKVLIAVFDRDRLYRIGGDEFIAVLEGEDEIEGLFEALDRAITEANKQEKEYKTPLSMSKGYALYDQERDKEYREVAHRADDAMYADKAEYYKGHDRRRR